MPTERHREPENPFRSPIKVKVKSYSMPTTRPNAKTEEPDILATADLLLQQLKDLEILYSTVDERVQRKRKALKELEYLVLGSPDASPRRPACPTNTPIGPRLRCFVSPRLRGLFDVRGPSRANLDSIQTCLDYSPDVRTVGGVSAPHANLQVGHSRESREDWVDDDDGDGDGDGDGDDDGEEEEEAQSESPFDDKYELVPSPRKVEKKLPATSREGARADEVFGSRIPRKVYVRREVSTSRRMGRQQNVLVRSSSHRRRPSLRKVKAAIAGSELQTKGTMSRGSWKQSMLENAKMRGAAKGSFVNENRGVDDRAGGKERRNGLWSIYSVCSELGPHAV